MKLLFWSLTGIFFWKQNLFIPPADVWSVLLRQDLKPFKKRLKALEARVAQNGVIFTKDQSAALKWAKEEKEAYSETETHYSGYLIGTICWAKTPITRTTR